MGNAQGLGFNATGDDKAEQKKKAKDSEKEEKLQGTPPPTAFGKRKRKSKGVAGASKMPTGMLIYSLLL